MLSKPALETGWDPLPLCAVTSWFLMMLTRQAEAGMEEYLVQLSKSSSVENRRLFSAMCTVWSYSYTITFLKSNKNDTMAHVYNPSLLKAESEEY